MKLIRRGHPRHAFSWLSCLVFCLVGHSATSKAVRPGVNTEAALKRLKMSMPVDLQAVIERNQTGLDLEDSKTRQTVEAQAREYVSYRKGTLSEAKWQKSCHSPEAKNSENPFCIFEQERHERTRTAKTIISKTARHVVATELKAGNFNNLATLPYQELIGGVSALGDFSVIRGMAERVSAHKSCVPSSVSYALGYKLEEGFPDPQLIETSKKLYRASVDCGSDVAAATSSFRLGLIEIWQHDCTDVQSLMLKTEKTAGASPFHARAKYWRYYCAGVQKDEVARNDARNSLLRDHPLSFQNLAVNGDDLEGLSQVLRPQDPQLAFRSLVRPDLNPVLRGAEALMAMDQKAMATELLDHRVASINEMEPETRLYAAVLLNRMGSALPKFKILSNLFDEVPRMISSSTMKLYFPLWYFDLVKSKEAEIDPLLILSLIRQESAFNNKARSIVGARGLMQLMPATARTVARASRSNARNLFDPKTNINLGTTYLLNRLHQYGGDVELTLAAYNAGFGRVDDWRKRYPTDNKMLFLDFIPFRETRDYVSMILRNYYWYVKLYDTSPGQISALASAQTVDSEQMERLAASTDDGASASPRGEGETVSALSRGATALLSGTNTKDSTRLPASLDANGPIVLHTLDKDGTRNRPIAPISTKIGPKTSAIISANAGIAAGVITSP